ncbi:hypothetical protein TcWFU_002424 [Taenia crassiceps]|uniref:C2H2-type domain-containing protein n=1 Tax=Taenia crassiceps TaxID=6207 RepID=A0ABR4Q1W7_9CEST
MRQSRDEQRPQRCSTKVLRGECAVSDARSGCSSEETGDEVELLEAEVIDPEDEVKFLAETRVNEGEPSASDSKWSKTPKSCHGAGSCQPPKPKKQQRLATERKRRKNHHCNICGLAFGRLDVVLFHTEREHPTKRAVIDRLRLCLLRAAFDPKGHRLGNAEEGGSDVSSTSS